jgi:hypothetical protein
MNKSQKSTLGRASLLKRALEGSKSLPSTLAQACMTQGALAKYDCASEGIAPMSLNTLKVCADKYIENGGWQHLDTLRKNYISIILKKRQTQPSAYKKDEKTLLAAISHDLEMERRYRLRLQVAYESLLSRLRNLALHDPEIEFFIKKHINGFSCKRLTLTQQEEESHEG